jgi:hypothetical protein
VRLLTGLLAWLTDAPLADSTVGDLEEGRRTRGQSASTLRASAWFWRTAVAILLTVAGQRLADAGRAVFASGGGVKGLGGDLRRWTGHRVSDDLHMSSSFCMLK